MARRTVTLAYGDGIGPEITASVVEILTAAGAEIDFDEIEVGEKAYLAGHSSGIPPRPGTAARKQGPPQGPHHHTPGRRLQEPQRHHPQDAGPVRQRAPLRQLSPLRRNAPPEHGHRDRARERGGPLRRHRAPPDRRGRPVPQAHQPPRLRAHRALRLRIRPQEQPPQGRLLREGQHHEDDRRPVAIRHSTRSARNTPRSRTASGSSTSAPPAWPTRRTSLT
jgi:hypothetical protein